MLDTPPIIARSYPQIPPWALSLVAAHLPYSLPLLSRLHHACAHPPAGPSAFLLSGPAAVHGSPDSRAAFTAAYVDFSAGHETHMWVYSTLEDRAAQTTPEFSGLVEGTVTESLTEPLIETARIEEESIVALFTTLKSLATTASTPPPVLPHDGLVLGSVHNVVRAILLRRPEVAAAPRPSGFYDKWLFNKASIAPPVPLPTDMFWATPTLADCELVVSRTDIPRQAHTLLTWPNAFVKLGDGTPIAWAFLSADGSITSLHCEPAYRGRGLAKRLVAKLLREETAVFHSAGWAAADVSPTNEASRGVCRAIGGKPAWVNSWCVRFRSANDY